MQIDIELFSRKDYPKATELINEFQKALDQYNEGAVLSIEVIAKIYTLILDNTNELAKERKVYDKAMNIQMEETISEQLNRTQME